VDRLGAHPDFRKPQVSIPDTLNDLLVGHSEEALDLLRRAEMDDLIACEWIEGETGRAVSGKANAACAAYLAFALRYALNAFLPEAAAVQKARKAYRDSLPAAA